MRSVSSSYICAFLEASIKNGADADALYKIVPGGRRALDCKNTDPLSNRQPVDLFLYILQKAEDTSGKPEIGLICGQNIRPSSVGELGSALLLCDTLRQAISINIRYQPLTQQIGRSVLETHGDKTWLVWESHYRNPEYCRRVTEAVMAGHIGFGRWLTWAHHKQIVAVHFRHARPDHAKKYEEIFECPVLFNQEKNAMVINTEDLDLPLPQANPDMLSKACVKLDLAMLRMKESISFADLVLKVLLMDFPNKDLSLEYTAANLGIGGRSLRRKLANEGSSFREVAAQARKTLCSKWMDEGVPLLEIAGRLGYAQQSSFNRAFKTWHGCTPKNFSHRQEPSDMATNALAS